jgi:hypothetical protein
VASLEVQLAQAGEAPTYVAAVAPQGGSSDGYDRAIVLNVLSQNATLLTRDPQGALTTSTYPATADANSWAISPDGRWAIAWTNTTLLTDAGVAQAYETITILDVHPPDGVTARPPTTLETGYRPFNIAYSNDSSFAYAATEAGIVVVDLVDGDAPTQVTAYPFVVSVSSSDGSAPDGSPYGDGSSADASPVSDGSALDASLSVDAAPGDGTVEAMAGFQPLYDAEPLALPSGVPDMSFSFGASWALALIRSDGVPSITLLSLLDGTQSVVNLPGDPTDLAVSPNGDFAVAVLRDSATVEVLPLPGILQDPTAMQTVTIPGETIGQAVITAKGSRVLLFTTAAPVSRMTVLTLAPTPSYQTVELYAPIMAVFAASDEKSAVVLHSMTPANGIEGAFSLVPIAGGGLPNMVALPAPATAVALSQDGDRVLVAMSDPNSQTYGVVLGEMPSFVTSSYPLASPPTAVGIVEGPGQGYAAQSYADGRITFVDLGDGGARTITGFELNARIVNGGGDQ